MGAYVWPCPAYSRLSSRWGNRVHPIYGDIRFHDGIDLAASSNTDILAAASGTVKYVGWVDGYGNYVSIDHGNGMVSFYAHCYRIDVSVGQTVSAGKRIAGVGTTGNSTGEHLHFGMNLNGSSVDPLEYVSDSDSTANYSGLGGGASTTQTVKAKFTAYYPADNAMEGGFYDAMGNLLDPNKKTCAAPSCVALGSYVTVQGTGTAYDGLTYKVNDRGGLIVVSNGVYCFDLLMQNEEEANEFGVEFGTAIISSDGNNADSESTKKDITKVVIKSVTGVGDSQKSDLKDLPIFQQAGVEILIQNDQIYAPCISGDVSLERERKDTPAKLTFTTVKDDILNFQEGNPVSFRYCGENMFHGYVFSKTRSLDDPKLIKVTCYDQIFYLKNKDTLSYENKTYAELLQMIADDYGLACGTLEDTEHVIESRIEEATLLDMLGNASDLTLCNTGKLFVLYDDYGKLTLKNIQSMKLDLLIDENTAKSGDYTSGIDKDTYNCIKLAVDNEETGEREVHVLNDQTKQSTWGVLQYYEKVDTGTSEAIIKERAEIILNYYNKKRRSLKVKGCFGDVRVRGGSAVIVNLNLGDMIVSNYMCVEKVTHTFSHGSHTMDLTLSGIKGEFSA